MDVPDDGTDVGAVRSGYISVTPVTLDMTNHPFVETLAAWDFAAVQPRAEQS